MLILPNTIPDAKQSADDTPVALLGPVVTASFSDSFYVENADRTSGILVVSDAMPAEDSMVVVHGVMGTVYEERCITASSVEVLGETDPIDPLCTSLRSIGGGDFGTPPLGQKGITGGYGLNNMGLLMRTSGEVDYVHATLPWFVITDGTHRTHCTPPAGTQLPALGDFCVVTGVSCMGYVTPDNLQRCLIPRRDSDIQVLQVP